MPKIMEEMFMVSFKILLITTGGTIAQAHDAQGRTILQQGGQDIGSSPFRIRVNEIINRLNNTAAKSGETYAIEVIDIYEAFNKDSSNVISEDWVVLIDKIIEQYDNYDAFVITHGTNTLGYTSSALSFALGRLGKPIVLTGSQVSFDYPGSDALMNLENAIRIAAYSKEKLNGVMVVFGSMIISGTRVKKTTEFNYDAFKSFNIGSLGRIGNFVRIDRDNLIAHMSFLGNPAKLCKELEIKKNFDTHIASLTEYPGMDSSIFRALVEGESEVKGFILRATGAGDPNVVSDGDKDKFRNLRDGFEYLRNKGIPIVVTTQAPDGIASMDINTPGIEAYALGAIPAKDMSMESMTVKLAWLLGRKIPYDEMREMMTTPFRGEIRRT
jgi:L-asparaginase